MCDLSRYIATLTNQSLSVKAAMSTPWHLGFRAHAPYVPSGEATTPLHTSTTAAAAATTGTLS